MPNICQGYAKDMPKICRIYTKDMMRICQWYAQDTPKICQRYANIPTELILWINLRENSRINEGKSGARGEWGREGASLLVDSDVVKI